MGDITESDDAACAYPRTPTPQPPIGKRPDIPLFPEQSADREILRAIHNMVSNIDQEVYDIRQDVHSVKEDQIVTARLINKHNKLAQIVVRLRLHVGILWTCAGGILTLVGGTIWKVLGG